MKYLNQEYDVWCDTEWSGINGAVGTDFPLKERLKEMPAGGNHLYHPVKDHRLKDLPLSRYDSPQRLNHIFDNMAGETVLDIGCAEGYFSR